MRSGDVNSPPSLSHKQTELCICENVVLYINSASYIAEMVLRYAWGTCNSDERYPERMQGYRFISFPKPKMDLEKCKRWIKACGRPHDQLNIHRINKHKAVCSKVRIINYLLPI